MHAKFFSILQKIASVIIWTTTMQIKSRAIFCLINFYFQYFSSRKSKTESGAINPREQCGIR